MHRHITTSSRVFGRGFTIVELLMVIVVLSILMAVAIDSVIGYQSRARDREREADTAVITQAIERYYRTHAVAVGATYPTSAMDASDLTLIVDNLDAAIAPGRSDSSIEMATSKNAQDPTINEYIYQPLNINGSLCSAAPCVKYKLYYRLEVTDTMKVRNSLRQQ